MAMATGSRGGHVSAINMTPMIDVLLVLLIIFMVVQQGLQRGLPVQVPPPDVTGTVQPSDNIVLEVGAGGRYLLNQRPVAAGALEATLAQVFAPRPRKVLFVKGGEQVAYAEVVRAVDASRAAGVDVVGLVPRAAGRD
ncbi:MAG: biopolymer transporter ExbD [Gemmatimonadetes bacterium]|nr:biopolymer transporter ExbD [Gemmatimonadota bacterium]